MQWPKLWNTTVLCQPFFRNGETVLLFDLGQHEINALPYERVKKRASHANTDVYYDIELMIAQQIELLHHKKEDEVTVEDNAGDETGETATVPRREKLHPGVWYDSFGQKSEEVEFDYRRYQFFHMNEWNIDSSGVSIAAFDHHVNVTEEQVRDTLAAIQCKEKMEG